jgi:hypothetical protein
VCVCACVCGRARVCTCIQMVFCRLSTLSLRLPYTTHTTQYTRTHQNTQKTHTQILVSQVEHPVTEMAIHHTFTYKTHSHIKTHKQTHTHKYLFLRLSIQSLRWPYTTHTTQYTLTYQNTQTHTYKYLFPRSSIQSLRWPYTTHLHTKHTHISKHTNTHTHTNTCFSG